MTPALKTSLGVIVLIFFFNRFLLPFNLQFTLVLAPFLFYYLVKHGFERKLLLPIFVFSVFSLIHLFQGVVLKDFVFSSMVGLTLIVFFYSFLLFYKKTEGIDLILKRLTQLNFIFTVIALFSLVTGWFLEVFWYLIPFTAGYETIPRLKLFQLEASHYSFALMPLFFYYFWKVMKQFSIPNLLLLLSILLSLLLSFSLGIIAVILFSVLIVMLLFGIKLLRFKSTRKSILFLLASSLSVLIGLIYFYPDNPLFFRIDNLFNGLDTSGRGRTYEALEIGWEVLFQNNPLTGIGLGQFKIIGRETLLEYYHFTTTPDVARLPNCIAETLVTFGLLGLSIKLGLQAYFFVKFKVYLNLFQLSLFFALFIYQFTGSYLFNSMEYVLWIIAFCPKLSSFNSSKYFAK